LQSKHFERRVAELPTLGHFAAMKSRVVAHLKMKPEAEGGRHAPFTEGYRPHFVIPPDGEYLCVTAIQCPGPVAPGDEVDVEFHLDYHPRVDYSALQVGTQFEMREGSRAVATGRIERRFDDVA
jgi:translation elongation factor EF-Tu-like GTPase